MDFLKNMLVGFVMGIGALAPGSGGALFAMIVGVYEKLLNAVGNFFKNVKQNFLFLLPIGIGCLIGIVVFSNVLDSLLDNYPMQTVFALTGFIIGTFPILFKKANQGEYSNKYLIPFCIAFVISLCLAGLDTNNIASVNVNFESNFVTGIYLFLAGLGLACSLIIPGINGTILMSMMGVYRILLRIMADLKNVVFVFTSSQVRYDFVKDLIFILPMVIGLAIGAVIFSKLISVMFNKNFSMTYYGVLGFIVGSSPALIMPYISQMRFNTETIVSVVLLMVFTWLSSLLDKFENTGK